MKLQVKNMICPCCEAFVKSTLEQMGLEPSSIHWGEITIAAHVSETDIVAIEASLRTVGLELLFEQRDVIVERVKSMVRELVNKNEDPLKVNLSCYLSDNLHYNYSYVSNLFSKTEGMTIRDFGIGLRIERAKRMLVFESLDLMEISERLHYSSAAHLAAQFKKTTGITTSAYKRSQVMNQIALLPIAS